MLMKIRMAMDSETELIVKEQQEQQEQQELQEQLDQQAQ